MKLLMISGDRSVLQGKRGAFWYTLEEMSKHWERIDIICPQATKNQQPATSNEGIVHTFFNHVHFHPSPRALWQQPWWILEKGSELIAEHHHDVMTVHSYPPFYNDIGAKWLHRSLRQAQGKLSIPFVMEIHHVVGYPIAASVSERIGYMLSRIYLPRATRCAAAVRCVSRSTAELLQRWNIPRIEVVPSFYLDADVLKSDASIEKKYDVVACARFVANKGMSELLHAINKMPDAKLLIIGDGPLRSSLESQAQHLGIANRVTFAGWLSENADVYRALQSGKIFVMNSKSEGGPRVALEAMALGLPIIATKVGVMPEVIEDGKNGLFTTGEPDDLAAKIEVLLHDAQLRERLGAESRKVLDRFERCRLIQKYAGFLKHVASLKKL